MLSILERLGQVDCVLAGSLSRKFRATARELQVQSLVITALTDARLQGRMSQRSAYPLELVAEWACGARSREAPVLAVVADEGGQSPGLIPARWRISGILP